MLAPFLKYVYEGRVVRRQSDLSRYTFADITERIYLTFLALSYLKHTATKFAQKYASDTAMYGNFDKVKGSANDLHNMLAVVAGDPDITKKLADKTRAQAMRQRQPVPVMAIKRYLRTMQDDYRFLSQLESALNISNGEYRNLKRALADYKRLPSTRRKAVANKLKQLLRAKLPNTDILKQFKDINA